MGVYGIWVYSSLQKIAVELSTIRTTRGLADKATAQILSNNKLLPTMIAEEVTTNNSRATLLDFLAERPCIEGNLRTSPATPREPLSMFFLFYYHQKTIDSGSIY